MKHARVVALFAFISLAADDETHPLREMIQGRWVSVSPPSLKGELRDAMLPLGQPRRVWTFEGDRWTYTRDAGRSGVIMGGRGGLSLAAIRPYPRYEARGTFRLIGTKVPRLMVLTHEYPKGIGAVEMTYELPDNDTFMYCEGRGFGRRCFATFKREEAAR